MNACGLTVEAIKRCQAKVKVFVAETMLRLGTDDPDVFLAHLRLHPELMDEQTENDEELRRFVIMSMIANRADTDGVDEVEALERLKQEAKEWVKPPVKQ